MVDTILPHKYWQQIQGRDLEEKIEMTAIFERNVGLFFSPIRSITEVAKADDEGPLALLRAFACTPAVLLHLRLHMQTAIEQ